MLVTAAATLLRDGEALTMRAVAHAAGVSRSTLYRHFDGPAALRAAVRDRVQAQVGSAVEHALRDSRPPLGQLRGVVAALVDIGAEVPWPVGGGPAVLADAVTSLRPLAERLAAAAGLTAAPAERWLSPALAHFADACLRAGRAGPSDRRARVDALLAVVTDPLDHGLVLLDAAGLVVAFNPDGAAAVPDGGLELDRPPVVRDGGCYEDGSRASVEAHPLSAALASGEPRQGVRGLSSGDAPVRWLSIDVRPLRTAPGDERYGFVAVFRDVTQQQHFTREQLPRPGDLRAATLPLLDIVRALDEVPAALLPDQLVAEAMRLAGGPVALYVLDIDGTHLLRLAGHDEFPDRLAAPLALGPELAVDGFAALEAHLAAELPHIAVEPMWLRGRAVGLLLALRSARSGIAEVARVGAAALELANGYTDVIDAARRRKDITPAAEIQQSLLPPRIARIGGGEIAGGVLPSYEVGGDWFDYVENRDGAWMAIADASGRGPQASGLGGVALAALRAARRNGATLEGAGRTIHETMCDVGGPEFFLTAIVARWQPVYSVWSWINCGHPPPLLIRADGAVEQLTTAPDLPLGIFDRARSFRTHQRRLLDGDRMILYSDGVSRRRTGDGLFGTAGIARAALSASKRSATATARAIQEAVVSASEDPLPDDAAVVVLAVSAHR